MFCIVVINKQKYCFERKNWIASKPKRQCFLSVTSSGKRIRESKISLKHARNQQRVMLILVITQSCLREVSIQKQSPKCFVKKDVLKNFANFTGKHLCWSLFWQNTHWMWSVEKVFLKFFQISQENTCVGVSLIKFVKNFIKKRLQHRCFPVKFAKFFKNTYFEEHLWTTASFHWFIS